MKLLILCLLIVSGIAVYFPTIYIRKTNRVIKLLEQIAANTSK